MSENTVFLQPEFDVLAENLRSLKNQSVPVVYTQRLQVQRNDFWGIAGGWEVEIVWSYLETFASFENALAQDIKDERDEDFPHILTLGDEPGTILYVPLNVRLLSHLGYWLVATNAESYRAAILGQNATTTTTTTTATTTDTDTGTTTEPATTTTDSEPDTTSTPTSAVNPNITTTGVFTPPQTSTTSTTTTTTTTDEDGAASAGMYLAHLLALVVGGVVLF
jgi:hypothetical protein